MSPCARAAGRLALPAVVAALVLASVSGGFALPSKRDEWIRIDTENLTIFSNASSRRAQEIGRQLEQFREVLSRITGGTAVDSPIPTLIYIFKGEASFRPYKVDREGEPGTEAGYFLGSPFGNYIAVDASASDPLATVFHEYVHYFTNNILPDLPQWLHEGLAEFYSTFRLERERAEIGHPIQHHLDWLSGRRMLPLRELFSVTIESPDYNETSRQGTFYAQSWVLVHYLAANDPEKRDLLGRFLAAVDRGEDPEEAFQDAYGIGLSEMERDLQTYVRRGEYRYYWIPFEEDAAKAAGTVAELDRGEVLYRLADLLVHRRPLQRKDLERHLREGSKLAPENAGLHVVAALLNAADDDLAAAAGHYEQAVKLDPDDPRALSLYGWNVIERFFEDHAGETVAPDGTPEELDAARELFRRSLALDPDHPESLAGFGKTFLFDYGELRDGIRALSEATRALPRRAEIVLDLIVLTANSGSRSRAWAILDRTLRPIGEENLVGAAEEAILAAELREANRLIERGLTAEARDVLRAAVAKTDDPARRGRVEAQITVLDDHTSRDAMVQRFNAAVDAANDGDFERARGGLASVAEGSDDPNLRRLARDSLARIDVEVERLAWIERFNAAVELATAGNLEEALRIVEEIVPTAPDPELGGRARDLGDEIRKGLE